MPVIRDEKAEARLESLLLQGLESGKDAPDNQEFWREVKREAVQTLARKKANTRGKG